MKKKTSFLGTIRLFSVVTIILVMAIILCFEIIYHIRETSNRYEELCRDFYDEQKSHLMLEINRVKKRLSFQNQMIEKKARAEVKSRIEEAYGIALTYNRSKEGELKETLRSITYRNGAGYYFILDSRGTVLMNSHAAHLENQNILNLQDGKGLYFVKEITELALQKGEGFYTYLWYRDFGEGSREEEKIGYIKYYEPLDWIIGTSIFQEDIEKELQNSILASIDFVYADRPDYLFAVSRNGTLLNGPDKGINVYEQEEAGKRDFFTKLEEAADRGDGFFTYRSSEVKNDMEYLVYVDEVMEWGWLLGARLTSEELNTEKGKLEENLRNSIRREVTRMIELSLLFLLLTVLILAQFNRYLVRDLSQFSEFFRLAAQDNVLIDRKQLRFREFSTLAELANKMVREKISGEKERQKLRNLESLGYLAGGIAHEFNNCLMGIYGNIELAQREIPLGKAPRQYLESALESMEETNKLTNRLLTFSHTRKIRTERFSLLPLVEETLKPLREDRRIGLEVLSPKESMTIGGDRVQIRLLLEMVIANAREALAEGGGTITVAFTRETLIERFPRRLTGEFLRLDIGDNGRGIKEEDLPRIFDPYFTTKQMGRGLGLAVVFSIIHQHGGHVEAAQAPGGGTVISLYFPITADSADPV